MGEYADAMIEGDACMVCGVFMRGGNGAPRTCGACRKAESPTTAAPAKARKPKSKEAKRRKRLNYRRNVKARLALVKEASANT